MASGKAAKALAMPVAGQSGTPAAQRRPQPTAARDFKLLRHHDSGNRKIGVQRPEPGPGLKFAVI